MLHKYYNRIKTFMLQESHSEVLPGEWDRTYPDRPTIDEIANKWIEEKQVIVVSPLDYSVKLIEVKDNGKTRIFLQLLAITFVPNEVIVDERSEAQKEEEEKQSEIVAATSRRTGPESLGGPIRIDGPAGLANLPRGAGLDAILTGLGIRLDGAADGGDRPTRDG